MRLTHLVNYDCLGLQMDTKNWLERVEIKNKLHPKNRKALRGTYVISLPLPRLEFTLCLSNKKGHHEISEQVHESKLRKTCLYFVEVSISIACESENCRCTCGVVVLLFKRIAFFFHFRGRAMWSDVIRMGYGQSNF